MEGMPEWLTVELLLAPVIGGLIWLIRLEGKVNFERGRIDTLKEQLAELKALDADGHKKLQERINENGKKLDGISAQLNRVLGKMGHVDIGGDE